MRKAVKNLHFGGWREKDNAVIQIEAFARAGGTTARNILADLGVIPKIVKLLDCRDEHRRGLAATALVELANGSCSNKALMVEAGLLERLEKLTSTTASSSQTAFLLPLLLSISSLSKTPFHISPSYPSFLPLLTSALATQQTKLTTLSILSNLSADLHNAKAMVITSNIVPRLLDLSVERESSVGALATLSNLVVTAVGRNAIEADPLAPGCFIEAMRWGDVPRCQELATYIVMTLVHRSVEQRRRIAEVGGVQVLLEVALCGSSLARRRAAKVLEWVKGERAKGGLRVEVIGKADGHRREMQRMVKQSLDRNLECLMRRASKGGGEGMHVFSESSSYKSLSF